MRSAAVAAKVIILALMTAACNKSPYADLMTPPSAYLHWGDRLKAMLKVNGLPGPQPCMEKSGDNPVPVEGDQCWRLEQPRRWSGLYVWTADLKVFCPAPATECPSRDGLNMSWLEFHERPQLPKRAALLALDLVWRHTAYHSDGKRMDGIVVDKLISVREVEALER